MLYGRTTKWENMQNHIEILTVVKSIDEKGVVNYAVNGSLPLDEAAKALVIAAFQAPRKPDEKIIEGKTL